MEQKKSASRMINSRFYVGFVGCRRPGVVQESAQKACLSSARNPIEHSRGSWDSCYLVNRGILIMIDQSYHESQLPQVAVGFPISFGFQRHDSSSVIAHRWWLCWRRGAAMGEPGVAVAVQHRRHLHQISLRRRGTDQDTPRWVAAVVVVVVVVVVRQTAF